MADIQLNEERARAALEAAVQDSEGLVEGPFYWDANTLPRNHDHESDVQEMLQQALEGGWFDGLDGREIELYIDSADDGDAYMWALRIKEPVRLLLGGMYEEWRHIGDPDLRGVEAGMVVLREAVQAANQLQADLDAYVSLRSSRT